MWMGGVPPLGYRAQDRKLVIVDSEAEIVRFIFRRYAELGSVRLLKDKLEACGIKSKSWTSASGRLQGGKPFARGALYLMLQNRIYRGEASACRRLREKGGKRHAMPCHHNLEEYLTAYLDGAELRGDPKGPLFRTIGRGTAKLTQTVLPQANAYAMIRRRRPAPAS
jgi:hypothetical protein